MTSQPAIFKPETYYQLIDGVLTEVPDPMPQDGYDRTPLCVEDPEDEDGYPSLGLGGAYDGRTVFEYRKGSDPTIESLSEFLNNSEYLNTEGYFFGTDEYSNNSAFEPTGRMFVVNTVIDPTDFETL